MTVPCSFGRLLVAALATGAALALVPAADAQTAVSADPDSSLTLALAGIVGMPLDLQTALAAARANATAVLEAQAALDAAHSAARRERGTFDPSVFARAETRTEDQPTASPFSGASVLHLESTSSEVGARMRLPVGTELSVRVEAIRRETNSSFATLVPQYDAVGQLEIRQPLLAGFGPASRQDLTAAERDLESAQSLRDDTLLAVEATTEMIYWDLYAATRDYAVQQIIRDRAQRLVVEAQTRAQVGLVGPNEVANAQVFLAEQEQAVLDQQQRLDGISDQLASLLGRRPEGNAPRFLAVMDPPREVPVQDQDSLVAEALRTNLALRAAEREVESFLALERGASRDALPQLDLFATVGGYGLSGTGQDVTFGGETLRTEISGGVGDALGQTLSRDYPIWSAGVEFSVPIGRREGTAERDRLRAEVRRSEQRYVATARSLEQRVRASHRELANGQARLDAARRGVDASLEQVRIGLLEFSNGQVTAFELVRLGADLATAQQRYSQALVRSAKALAEIRYLTSAGQIPAEAH